MPYAGALAANPGVKQQTYVLRTAQGGANGVGVSEEATHALDASGPEAVACEDVAGALLSRDGKGASSTIDGKLAAVPIPLNLRKGARAPEKDSAGCWGPEDGPAYNLSAQGKVPGVLQAFRTASGKDTTGALCAAQGPKAFLTMQDSRGDCWVVDGKEPVSLDVNSAWPVHGTSEEATPPLRTATRLGVASLAVRRLTPKECERLQGFPDGWTDTPWKRRPHAPDTLRYRALGNSMAVPVMRYLLERIRTVDARA